MKANCFLFSLSVYLLVSYPIVGQTGKVMTVNGLIPASEMGITLTHEHILVDFIGAAHFDTSRYNKREVIEKALPFLTKIKEQGVKTFIECTPEFLGRDPIILKRLSEETGLQILTNTGFYGANNNKFIPAEMLSKSAEEFAQIWIHEFKNGIRNTAVKPGFIKISVDRDSLSHFHTQLIKAAALTHLETGLVIASHTGPYIPAFQQIEILEKNNVSPEAFIWVHAHDEKNLSTLSEAAEKGAWISLDYLNENNVEIIINIIQHLKKTGHLSKILLSHDAGWFDPAKPNGGEFRGFNVLIDKLVPTLQNNGFSNDEIKLLLIENPANAFQIKARRK